MVILPTGPTTAMPIYRLYEEDDGGVQRGGIEVEHEDGGVQQDANESEQEPERPGSRRPGLQPQDNRVSDGVPAPPHRLPRRTASIRDLVNEVNETPQMLEINKFRVLCGTVVNHPKVQILIIALIFANAIMMGVATFDFVADNPATFKAFEVADMVFLAIFTVELSMQFVFKGVNLFRDGWLTFDFLIVVVSWSFTQEDQGGVQIIRAFRIFRTLRLINRIETMRNLVTALFDIMPRLGAITALLLLIFYIFAVLFTQLFGHVELEDCPAPFSRLDHSFLTLFIFMTMEWADIARGVMAEIWWAWLPIVIFIMITGFIVFNLIIAVVCDAVAVIENKKDLQGEFLTILGSRDEFQPDNSKDGASSRPVNNDGTVPYKEKLVVNMAERMPSMLNNQKDLLLTLESLVKEVVPMPEAVLMPEAVPMPEAVSEAVSTPETVKQGENSRPEDG